MLAGLLDLQVLSGLSGDGRLLFATRMLRMFGYGLVAVVLLLHLRALGFSESAAGMLLTLTLVGDTVISLWITTTADRIGRRRMLVAGAVLMLAAGLVFAVTDNYWLLLLAATLGVISPTANEVGPFLAIEQAGLSQLTPAPARTGTFAWYNLSGSLATAAGSLVGGVATWALQQDGMSAVGSYRVVLAGYALIGALMGGIFLMVSGAVEVERKPDASVTGAGPVKLFLGLHRSRGVVLKLSALFALDAFAGGFVMQSILAYWFKMQFGMNEAKLGAIFFGANILAGFSALVASRMAARYGLINTMVYTHIPSNLLLMLVPLMPNLPLAIAVLLARFSISQMDVPTRQSYTMAVVDPDERSAAAGVTGMARTTGSALSPVIAGRMLAAPLWFSAPFFIAGGLKIVYDLMLWRSFRAVKTDEESPKVAASRSRL